MHKEFLKKLIETVCGNNLVWPKISKTEMSPIQTLKFNIYKNIQCSLVISSKGFNTWDAQDRIIPKDQFSPRMSGLISLQLPTVC